MASVLMVLIFVLMTFVLSQFYLTNALSDRNKDVFRLQERISKLLKSIGKEKTLNESLLKKNLDLENSLTLLQEEIARLNQNLSDLSSEKLQTKDVLISLEDKLKLLQSSYDDAVQNLLEKDTELSSLKEKHLKFDKLAKYRSKFFDKLFEIMKHRKDIRRVGDRFVFESEVFFDVASAQLSKEGSKQLDGLVYALHEIASQIPKDIQWILRIDGHTDKRPINTHMFPSNWELSAARAIAVVKYLNSKGVAENRLVAAGFAEHQPLTLVESEMARNRRIEFRFDLLR